MEHFTRFSFDKQIAGIRIDDIYHAVNLGRPYPDQFGFRHGVLGLAVFTYLYGIHTDSQNCLQQASLFFDKSCEQINSDRQICYPLDFPDLGIVCQYLAGAGVLKLIPNVFLADIDTYLLEKMRLEIREERIAGFSTGAIGYGLYFLHRASYDPDRFTAVLDELVCGISDSLLQNRDGYYWVSSPVWDNKPVDLSLLSGMSSVILFLAKAAQDDLVKKDQIFTLLRGAVPFICQQFLKMDQHKVRLGFQDGDLGIGYAVMRAGMVFTSNGWYNKGQQIIEQCAVTCLEDHDLGINNSVQSGYAGAALAFDKINRLCANSLLASTADFCLGRILEIESGNDTPGEMDLSFSQGLTGIGACMIKAANPDSINFDELLWLL